MSTTAQPSLREQRLRKNPRLRLKWAVRGIQRESRLRLQPVVRMIERSSLVEAVAGAIANQAPPRRFQAYCVGTSKSGTTSIGRMFAPYYRSAHEPQATSVIDATVRRAGAREDDASIRRYLRIRDSLLRLEMESSNLVFPLLDLLLEEFPATKHVLTVRNVYSWLNSEVNEEYSLGNRRPWKTAQIYRYAFERGPFSPHERGLEERGLHRVSTYCRYWTAHNSRVLELVPPQQLFVLRTKDTHKRIDELAAFLGADPDHVTRESVHSRRRRNKPLDIRDIVDPVYLEEQVQEHCADLMKRFFPEMKSIRDAKL